MTNPSRAELPRSPPSRQRPSELLHAFVSDPQSPQSDEVQRLVSAIEAQQSELEVENQALGESQRRLEAYRDRYVDLYDFAPLGYVTLDEDGYVQEINLAGAKMLGDDRDAITGYAFGEYVAKEDQEAFQEHVRKCAGDRREVTCELCLVPKDGQSIAVQLRSMSLDGPKEHVLCKTAITDITQRRSMEESIRQSREFLQTIIDAMPDTVLVIGRDFRLFLANRAARELAGGIDPTLCLTCHQFSHQRAVPCEGRNEPCPLREVVATRAPVRVTHTHYNSVGKEIFVEINAAPIFDQRGEVKYIVEDCRDITDRMRLERALRLTQFSVDHAGDPVYWLGPDARFFYVNARACQHSGYSQEELLSMSVTDMDPNFPATSWPQHWEEVKRRGSFTFESQHRTKDRGLVEVEITANYLEFEGKAYDCSFVRDITERKRAEQAILQLNERLRTANRELEAFTAAVCHDLRRPLHTINGFSQILAQQYAASLDETATGYLAHISGGVRQMAALIDDLMKLSRVTAAEVRRTSVDLSALVWAVVEGLRKGQPERKAEFVVVDGVIVEGDPHLLRVALENLLGNAWKFTGKHDKARIEFGVADRDGQPAYFVRDDGAGFDMKGAHKLFGVFQRMHAAEEFEGTGVGLATVERVIRAHGGRVWAEAAVEHGAMFFFTVPKSIAKNA